MSYNSLIVANEIIRRSYDKRYPIKNFTLQKLLYFAHGWSLAWLNEELVDSPFEAWRYGPLIPELYYKFKIFSVNPIPVDHPLSNTDAIDDEKIILLIDRIIDLYGSLSVPEISQLSYAKDGPWWNVYHNENDPNKILQNSDIKSYFKSLILKENYHVKDTL